VKLITVVTTETLRQRASFVTSGDGGSAERTRVDGAMSLMMPAAS
jgi:hypothetical protein